jgi:glutaredoxin
VRTVTLFGRPGCHLCDEARAALDALREAVDFELREVNIEADPVLLREHRERIPVVAVDGEIVSELVLDLAAVRARLASVQA